MSRIGSLPAGRRFAIFAVSLCALGGAGCGSRDGERLYPVTGTIQVDGNPLKAGAISLRPDSERGNHSLHHPTGTIDGDGNYRIFTTRRSGAPPGWYKVLVFADEANQAGSTRVHPQMPRWAVNAKYTSERTTDIWIEVVESPSSGSYDLSLTK